MKNVCHKAEEFSPITTGNVEKLQQRMQEQENPTFVEQLFDSLGHNTAETKQQLSPQVIDEVHGQAFGGLAGQAAAKNGRQAVSRRLDTETAKRDLRQSPRKTTRKK
jgi:poly-gamma-glutamate capsule biosynthesis protein CapA/YwtB (metallophosphatase superfamily)